jgi:flagellar biosynthetic protein FlhB
MSDDRDQESRILPATPRRLEQAREEGQVPRSRELIAAATVAAGAAGAWAAGPFWVAACERLLEHGLRLAPGEAFATAALTGRFGVALVDATLVLAPVLVGAALVAVLGGLGVGGWLYAPKAFMPDFNRLDPLRGLGNVFSRHGALELVKAIAKALVIGGVAAHFLWTERDTLAQLPGVAPRAGIVALGVLLGDLIVRLAAALLVIAALDVPLVLWRHYAGLRMTQEEVRRELRESEGDPQLKARIRSQQRERARGRMMAEVPKADLVVTNPTRFAVAIAYREGEMRAPRVVAKGQGEVASRIRETAAEHGVPLLEAPPLARALHRAVEIGDEIPDTLYDAVAQVLAWVYRLRRARADGAPPPPAPDALAVPPGLDPEGAGA